MKQPFLIVVLEDSEQIILNENHVVSIRKSSDGHAILSMSNGEKHVVVSPPYAEWDNDVHARKD